MIDNLLWLADECEKHGVLLAMENSPKTCATADQLLAYVARLGHANIRPMVDTTEVREAGGEPAAFVAAVSPCHLHLSDYTGDTKHLPAGEGDTDFAAVARNLGGYEGFYTLEPAYRYYIENVEEKLRAGTRVFGKDVSRLIDPARIQQVFTAFAVGDAVGMPTEFMTRGDIRLRFSALVSGLIPPAQSRNHANLPFASVTDDTEQNLYLYRLYQKENRVDANATANCLLDWVKETGAIEKTVYRPQFPFRADGHPVGNARFGGRQAWHHLRRHHAHARGGALARTRCRIGPCKGHLSLSALHASHLRGAGGRGRVRLCPARRALRRIEKRNPRRRDTRWRSAACVCAGDRSAPSSVSRIRELYSRAATHTPEHLLDDLYSVYGTGLPSADVCGAVFGIFFSAKNDVWKAIRMGASVGGDTDTIAALAGALCCAYAGGHNIPADVVKQVLKQQSDSAWQTWEEHN